MNNSIYEMYLSEHFTKKTKTIKVVTEELMEMKKLLEA